MESTANHLEEIILCPVCLTPLQAGGKCPTCGKTLDTGDWPEIPRDEGWILWSSQNLRPPAAGEVSYRLPPLTVPVEGKPATRLPYVFAGFGQHVIRIGGVDHTKKVDVRISGAASLHAVLLQNKRTEIWWIYDCGTAGGTFVNGERVHFQELQVGDVITIAGVGLAFRGNRLETSRAADDNAGMSLYVDDLCFAVKKSDGKEDAILDDVTFAVSPGEFIGVLGPSGCGKSSLVQRIMGLAKPDAGEVSGKVCVNGRLLLEWKRDKDKKSHLRWGDCFDEFRAATAYLPQNVEQTLHEGLTVKAEIESFRRIHLPPVSKEDEETETHDLLRRLGLVDETERIGEEKILKAQIGSLSGGQKRRVGIALALLRHAQLLLLDEPCAGLDPASESLVMQCFCDVAKKGATVLCVTHVLANLDLFDKVLVLSAGKSKGQIAYLGRTEDLFAAFGVNDGDFAGLYVKLAAGKRKNVVWPHYERPTEDYTPFEFPVVEEPSCCHRVCGYFWRAAMEFFMEFFTPFIRFFSSANETQFSEMPKKAWRTLKMVAHSAPFVLFVLQPLLLVAGIRLACAAGFMSSLRDIDVLGFCAALSMFWVGINNAVRELVKERVPGRCLESLNHVPVASYLLSKFLWVLFVCALQTLSFVALLWFASGRIEIDVITKDFADPESSKVAMSVWWYLPLYFSCLVGAFLGLAVSAFNKKMMSAISMVPNIAILALLFSNVMVRFDKESGVYFSVLARNVAHCTPCHWASEVLADIQNGVTNGFGCVAQRGVVTWSKFLGDLWPFLLVFAIYVTLSVFVVWFYQRRNEKAWDGRKEES